MKVIIEPSGDKGELTYIRDGKDVTANFLAEYGDYVLDENDCVHMDAEDYFFWLAAFDELEVLEERANLCRMLYGDEIVDNILKNAQKYDYNLTAWMTAVSNELWRLLD